MSFLKDWWPVVLITAIFVLMLVALVAITYQDIKSCEDLGGAYLPRAGACVDKSTLR